MSANWPPNQDINKVIDTYAAWWAGDPAGLSKAYGGDTTRRGIWGRLADRFWGTPTPPGQSAPKLHLPIAADIATTSARLLFGEDLSYTCAPDTPDTVVARLQELVTKGGLPRVLLEGAETASALTGAYLRITWDPELADMPFPTVVAPDSAIPTFRHGRLVKVAFPRALGTSTLTSAPDSAVWRHIESHEPGNRRTGQTGIIRHELWLGTDDKLGRLVPLTEHQDTIQWAASPDAGGVNEDGVVATGYVGLTAVYIPNITPQRGKWRKHAIGACYGRSDFDGITDAMDAADETVTSLMRDIRHGKSRLITPSTMLERGGPGQGAEFNLDQEVFVGLETPDANASTITQNQFEIRTQEHLDALYAILRFAYNGAGYSPSTFGLSEDGAAATATEINARERKTMSTREAKTRLWTPAIEEFLKALLAVDVYWFGGPGVAEVSVEFPAAVNPTLAEIASSVQILRAAEAASTRTLVAMAHPDWDDAQVDAEVELIHTESGRSVAPIESMPF